MTIPTLAPPSRPMPADTAEPPTGKRFPVTSASIMPMPAALPTSLTVFFDGASPCQASTVARYRRLCAARPDIRWRDLRAAPQALSLFGVAASSLARRPGRWPLFVVDRSARLRAGLDAMIKLWAELPRWRLLAALLTVTGVKALVARPLRPMAGAPPAGLQT